MNNPLPPLPPPDYKRPSHGVTLDVPASAPASGPIPVRVTYADDIRTYYANDGVTDHALRPMLVRRDLPGVALLATVDPRAYLLPLPKLNLTPEQIERDIEEREKQDDMSIGKKNLDLCDYGEKHDGAADYFVWATFSIWTSEVKPLTVTHPSKRLAPWGATKRASLRPGEEKSLPAPPEKRGVIAAVKKHGKEWRVEGSFRVAIRPAKYENDQPAPPFVSIVAAHLVHTGGASVESFVLDTKASGGEYAGKFSIPVKALNPAPEKGKYRFMVFSGDAMSGPIDVELD